MSSLSCRFWINLYIFLHEISQSLGRSRSSEEKQEKWNKKHLAFNILSVLKLHLLNSQDEACHIMTVRDKKRTATEIQFIQCIYSCICFVLLYTLFCVRVDYNNTSVNSCKMLFLREHLKQFLPQQLFFKLDSNEWTVIAQHLHQIPGK